MNHWPEEIVTSQVSYPTKIVDIINEEVEIGVDSDNVEKIINEEISTTDIGIDNVIEEINLDDIEARKQEGLGDIGKGQVIKLTSSGVQIVSETKGKLIVKKSQLTAQQEHDLDVIQTQPQLAKRKISKSSAKQVKKGKERIKI